MLFFGYIRDAHFLLPPSSFLLPPSSFNFFFFFSFSFFFAVCWFLLFFAVDTLLSTTRQQAYQVEVTVPNKDKSLEYTTMLHYSDSTVIGTGSFGVVFRVCSVQEKRSCTCIRVGVFHRAPTCAWVVSFSLDYFALNQDELSPCLCVSCFMFHASCFMFSV